MRLLRLHRLDLGEQTREEPWRGAVLDFTIGFEANLDR